MRGRVLIADDHPIVREALQLAVSANWPRASVDAAGSLAEIEALASRRGGYDLVLLDLMLPDAHGFSGLLMLQKLLPDTPVAIVSSRNDPQTVASAYVLGAAAFLPKSTAMTVLAEQVKRVVEGERVFPTAPAAAKTDEVLDAVKRLESLSAAQLRILLALADGRLNKQIAGDMNLSEATVKAHLTAIFRKLKVSNRTQAILAARPILTSSDDPA